MNIEKMKGADIEEVINVCMTFSAEINNPGFVGEPSRIRKSMQQFVLAPDRECFIAKHPETNKIMGIMPVLATMTWYNTKVAVTELTLYVLPEYRKLGVARELVHAALDWAKNEKRATIFRIGERVGIDPEIVKTFYEGEGFTCGGSSYYRLL